MLYFAVLYLVTAPRGCSTAKKVLRLVGVTNCHATSHGSTCTLGNFAKAIYTYIFINTCELLTPVLWEKSEFTKGPYQEFSDFPV